MNARTLSLVFGALLVIAPSAIAQLPSSAPGFGTPPHNARAHSTFLTTRLSRPRDNAPGAVRTPCGADDIPVPAPVHASAAVLDPVAAVNELQAIAWASYSVQVLCEARDSIQTEDGEEKVIAQHGRVCYGIGVCDAYAFWLTNVEFDAHIGAAPGLRYGCLVQSDCPAGKKPGFQLEIPLNGTWNAHIGALLHADASVWGLTLIPLPISGGGFGIGPIYLSCCVTKPLTIDLSNIKFQQTTWLSGPQDHPTVDSAQIKGHVTLQMDGAFYTYHPEDIDFTVDVTSAGKIHFASPNPIQAGVRFIDFNGAELPGQIHDLKIEISYDPQTDSLTVSSGMWLKVDLAEVSGESFGFDTPFSTSHKTAAPIGLRSSLPKSWGENAPQHLTVPANPSMDFAGAASQIEAAILKWHLPWGAVLSLDRTGPTVWPDTNFACPRTKRSPFGPEDKPASLCYSREWDSAIWTGHYLAAESFRYAATQSPDALARIKVVLDGIARLFWVTEDAAVGNDGHIVPVKDGPGLLARTAIRDGDLHKEVGDIPLADSPNGKVSGFGHCYYERPEGGWRVRRLRSPGHEELVSGKTFRSYAQAEIYGHPEPIPPVWYGLGCGERDESPISHDQYLGVFMGLAFAHALVSDQLVQDSTRNLLTRALSYLIKENWDVRVPPRRRIPAGSTSLGAWDQQLALLRIGASVNPSAVMPNGVPLGKLYEVYANGSKLNWIPTWTTVLDPVTSGYYKFNLSHALNGPTFFLETDPTLRQNYRIAYDILRRATRHHKNAYFNLVRILVESPPERSIVAGQPSGSNPSLSLQDEIKSILAEWLVRRDAVNAGDGLPLNIVADPSYQANLFNQDTHTSESGGVAPYDALDGSRSYVATFALPMSARNGAGLDFAWERGPFDVALSPHDKDHPACAIILRARGFSPASVSANWIRKCGSDLGNQEAPGVDYLLAYWIAVYLGIL